MSNYQESAEGRRHGLAGKPNGSNVTSHDTATVRAVVQIAGNVQGVGFRPFLYRLATDHGLCGIVANSLSGVDLEIEGPRCAVEAFLTDIGRRHPPLATITELRHDFREPIGHPAFVIASSPGEGDRTALISPDVAVCSDCLDELFDPTDRRHLYPFINCTNCGPRFTIIADVPYDRPATSMACFAMCPACQAEYDDPANRRFHAQPNACPECGPHVWLVKSTQDEQAVGLISNPSEAESNSAGQSGYEAIDEAVRMLQQGAIVAVKGLGGFHLACDATNAHAVATLRHRKQREEKPFALMVPDLETLRQLCHLEVGAETVITSRARPITLLPRRGDTVIADAVAQGNNDLGLMLPYAPLHHLLLFDKSRQPRFLALVMTSGNLSNEPIAIGNREALQRLRHVADAFLLHNRDILIRADDSVVRQSVDNPPVQRSGVTENKTTVIRRSRGYVPAPIYLDRDIGEVLAVGGHLKNTVAVSRGKTVFLSQHIGDLENFEALEFLQQSIDHLQGILGIRPTVVAHDMHPDYLSTRYARQLESRERVRLVPVQHHHAHVAACMAEHGLDGPVIGVALDGTGYGPDGNVWGGEILIADYSSFQRVAHLREVPLPGNERATQQPWRMALSYLDAAFGESLWSLPIPFVRQLDRPTAELLLRAARRGVNSPLTSSCGRLFDAVAALVGLRQTNTYEGQAAIELEMAMDRKDTSHVPLRGAYQMVRVEEEKPTLLPETDSVSGNSDCRSFVLDQVPLIKAVVADIQAQIPLAVISRRFHQALTIALAGAVGRIAEHRGVSQVVLNGGCFQNGFLQHEVTTALEALELSVFSPRLVPPNDGGLALGQVMVASCRGPSL